VLAVVGWLRHPPDVVPVAESPVEPPAEQVKPPPTPPTPVQARDALLARADSVKITLAATKDPAGQGVTADVVWDPVTQMGFAHFAGLKSNDPQVKQYQLWIFDATRDKRYPVDGGVFDVPADAPDVVIPIRATLPVRQAAAFAVTVEKPGGAVVSDLSHVVVLGKAG
jgi:anti-sigma-K factor RskA